MDCQLSHRLNFPVAMGKRIFLQYRPALEPIVLTGPAHVNSPNLPAFWHGLQSSRGLRSWCTSFDNHDLVLRWFKRTYPDSPSPDEDETWQRNLQILSQVKDCQTDQFDSLDLPDNALGMKPMRFQVNGAWFLLLRKRALLADPVGLGKTLQFSMAWKQGVEWGLMERALICTQKSTLYQIAEEFERVTFCQPTIIPEKLDLWDSRSFLLECTDPVVILNHHRLRDLITETELGKELGGKFDVLILDEAQVIKTRTSQMARAIRTVSSPYLWLITATPIENSLAEAHSLLQFIDPFLFGSWTFFENRYCIKDFFGSIINYRNTEDFREKIEKVTLRRERKVAQKSMPDMVHVKVKIPISGLQQEVYEGFLEEAREMIRAYEIKTGKEKSQTGLQILELYNVLRQVCDHPALISEDWKDSAKLRWLVDQANQKKVNWVVFTQWIRMQELIIPALMDIPDINLFMVNGEMSAKARKKSVDNFHLCSGNRVLICTDAAKCGLNLQAADTLINMERHFNPATADQRGGRIDRLGANGTKKVITLFTPGTVEERIEELVAKKRDLSDKILSIKPPMEAVLDILKCSLETNS